MGVGKIKQLTVAKHIVVPGSVPTDCYCEHARHEIEALWAEIKRLKAENQELLEKVHALQW